MDGMFPVDAAPPGTGGTKVFAHKGWRAARKAVLSALAQPGWVVLTGPQGIGKSLLLARLPHLLEPRPVRWLDPDQRPLPHDVDDGAVWLLDHADRLSDGLLAMLARNGLNLVLAAPAGASARIVARGPARVVTIGRVPPEEIAEYLKTRLQQLGRAGAALDEAALERLKEAGGVPRTLNTRIDDELAAPPTLPELPEPTGLGAPVTDHAEPEVALPAEVAPEPPVAVAAAAIPRSLYQALDEGPVPIISPSVAPAKTTEPEPATVAAATVAELSAEPGPPMPPPAAALTAEDSPSEMVDDAVEPTPALAGAAQTRPPPLVVATDDDTPMPPEAVTPAQASLDQPASPPISKPILAASGFPVASVRSRRHYRDLGIGVAVGALILLSLAGFLIGLRRQEASRVVTLDFSAKHPATIALTAPPRPLPAPGPTAMPARPALAGIDARTIAAQSHPVPAALGTVPGQHWLAPVAVVPPVLVAAVPVVAAPVAAATTPPIPMVALPAAVPVTVLLRYPVRGGAAQREAQTVAATLRAQGYAVQMLPRNAAAGRRQVGFFYQEDAAAAARAAAAISDRSPPLALPMRTREPVAPGTIEISLP